MRVIVVGAGEVGTHVAQLLSREGSDVTVIESSAAPGEVLIDQATFDGAGAHAAGFAAEQRTLKGMSRQVPVYSCKFVNLA